MIKKLLKLYASKHVKSISEKKNRLNLFFQVKIFAQIFTAKFNYDLTSKKKKHDIIMVF